MAPCLTPCILLFSQEPTAGPYWCLYLQTWSMTVPWPESVRGSVRGPLVLSNQAGHGSLQKWSNYKLAEWLKFSVLELDRNGF